MYYLFQTHVGAGEFYPEHVDVNDQKLLTDIFNGKRIVLKDATISFPKSRGKIMSFIDNVHSLFVLNQELKEVIERREPSFLQIFPVEIKRKVSSPYYYIKILENIDCIDDDLSIYSEYIAGAGIFWKLDKLELDLEKISNRNIFRIERLKTRIFVSEVLKEEIEDLDLEGISFIHYSEFVFDSTKSNINN